MMFRHSKIVCTIGPATSSARMIERLIEAGMDVARLNFSHGTHAEHAERIAVLREAAVKQQKPIAILGDLQGPKIRTGPLAGKTPVELKTGQRFVITTAKVMGDANRVSTIFRPLPREVHRGNRILLSDGLIELRVTRVRGEEVICEVVNGGTLGENKGINLPGVKLRVPALTGKDREDLAFALKEGVNYVAVSFVRHAEDVVMAKNLIRRAGRDTPVIAKLEKPEAVADLEAVVAAFDGIMVARGDLGVELPLERVPVVQKRAVQLCRENAKPVIVATQMLDSMIANPRPTRAEVSDVANAVLDGADAVMLSGETSIGKYPIESVRTMTRIAAEVESEPVAVVPPLRHSGRTVGDLIAQSARDIGEGLGARALVAFTQSGDTVRRLARLHPRLPLLAFTPIPSVRSQLALTWGVETFLVPPVDSTDAVVRQVDEAMMSMRCHQPGDLVVIVAGSPPGTVGSTNMIRIHRLYAEDHA